MVVGHHLLLHKSPLIMTNYIDAKIKELDLGVLHWVHFTHMPCTEQNKV